MDKSAEQALAAAAGGRTVARNDWKRGLRKGRSQKSWACTGKQLRALNEEQRFQRS